MYVWVLSLQPHQNNSNNLLIVRVLQKKLDMQNICEWPVFIYGNYML